jgi:DegV family protein with EDD domain
LIVLLTEYSLKNPISMPRPTILLVEPSASRRQALGNSLASKGFEVVPTSDAAEGLRFARGLGPALIVAPASLPPFSDATILDELAPSQEMERTLVLLGERPEEEADLPGAVFFLTTANLSTEEIGQRLGLLLLSREVEVEADAQLASLVGDLAQRPLLELVRALNRAMVSGLVVLERGRVIFYRGEVVDARAGSTRGLKAFCRLARLAEAAFRVVLDEETTSRAKREIEGGLSSLISTAIRDSLGQFPDPETRVQPGQEGNWDSLTSLQQRILQKARKGTTVQELLDSSRDLDGEIVQELLVLEEQGAVVLREALAGVQIVTDSTADLPVELAREHGITVVPLGVQFGRKAYRDRVDLQPRDFYRILEQKIVHPVSNPPSLEDFEGAYRPLLERGDVLSLHLSSKLSKTFENARKAAARLGDHKPEDRRLIVHDTGFLSTALGLLALFAARLAARGENAAQILFRLKDMEKRLSILFVVETLEYLARGGRIGRAQAWFGGLMRIKPILGILDGEIAPIKRVRGRRAALASLKELLHQRTEPKRPTIVAITHARAPMWADRIRQWVEQDFQVSELIISETGPVIGTHVGPGAFSLVTFQPTDEEIPLIAPLTERQPL